MLTSILEGSYHDYLKNLCTALCPVPGKVGMGFVAIQTWVAILALLPWGRLTVLEPPFILLYNGLAVISQLVVIRIK